MSIKVTKDDNSEIMELKDLIIFKAWERMYKTPGIWAERGWEVPGTIYPSVGSTA